MNGNRMAENLVESIRKICREKSVSIMQMESDLGFSAGLISRWSKTKTCPSFDKIVDIMDYLDITYDELMRNDGSFRGREENSSRENRNKYENDEEQVMIQLEKGTISGDIKWEKAGEDVPFKIKADIIFQYLLSYDIHRIYYTAYGKGWFLLSLQYNEETSEVLVAAYILPAAGMDMVELDTSDASRKRLLKVIDEEIFNRINRDQVNKMKEDFMKEDFQDRYRSVS